MKLTLLKSLTVAVWTGFLSQHCSGSRPVIKLLPVMSKHTLPYLLCTRADGLLKHFSFAASTVLSLVSENIGRTLGEEETSLPSCHLLAFAPIQSCFKAIGGDTEHPGTPPRPSPAPRHAGLWGTCSLGLVTASPWPCCVGHWACFAHTHIYITYTHYTIHK